MKKVIPIFVFSVLILNASSFAQTGRPAKIGDNAPVITPRNSLDKDVATLAERVNAMEKRIASLEADNSGLKTENATLKSDNEAQGKQIMDLQSGLKANYKILENYTTTLKNRFDSQVGDFRITGFISNKSLGTSGAVNLLIGTH